VPPRSLLACLIALIALAVAGCGGGDDDDRQGGSDTSTTAAKPVDFPRAGRGTTLGELRAELPEGPVFAPSVSVLRKGSNRIGFALFDRSRKQVSPEAVAVYASRPSGGSVRGPYVARRESLAVKPQFRSRQTQADLDEVDQFWVADVELPKQGRWVMTALASVGGELVATSQYERRITTRGAPPDVGDRAIRINTPTVDDVGRNLEEIDTRIPPLPDMHRADFADVMGRKPAVLVFATPQLCQTRVCGPSVDVALEVQAQTEGVEFIHMEIYKDNEIAKGLRPEPAAWRLPTEPWVFVVGRDGRIAERFEGAVSVPELTRAVEKVRG
jgi:hypothetical protein